MLCPQIDEIPHLEVFYLSTPALSFPDLFFLISKFYFFNIIHQEWLKSHLLHEVRVDPYSKMFQVSFEHVSYAPFNFEYFFLMEKQNRS